MTYCGVMSVAEIKDAIRCLESSQLDEVAALILQLRRAKDPERKKQLSELIDHDDRISWKKKTEADA